MPLSSHSGDRTARLRQKWNTKSEIADRLRDNKSRCNYVAAWLLPVCAHIDTFRGGNSPQKPNLSMENLERCDVERFKAAPRPERPRWSHNERNSKQMKEKNSRRSQNTSRHRSSTINNGPELNFFVSCHYSKERKTKTKELNRITRNKYPSPSKVPRNTKAKSEKKKYSNHPLWDSRRGRDQRSVIVRKWFLIFILFGRLRVVSSVEFGARRVFD